MSNYLVHHGILGQKWGKKNGPPYPLDYNKLSSEERSKAKADAIRRGDIKEAHANRNHYTDNEINEVINRFNINQKLSQLNAAQVQNGITKAKKFCNTMGEISEYGEKAIKGYNTIAKLSNSLAGTKLPKIGDNNQNQNKGNNNNNQNNNNNNQNNNSKQNKDSVKIIKDYSDGELTKKTKVRTTGNKTVTVNKNYNKDK